MKIYIAGKITGETNYRQKFIDAAKRLYKKQIVTAVLNPVDLPFGLDYEDYMHICFAMIDVSDCVYLLPDWQDSPGAKREYEYCQQIGKEVGLIDFEGNVLNWNARTLEDVMAAEKGTAS